MNAVTTTSTQLCTFALGELLLGLDVRRVQEVLRNQPMTPVPLSGHVIRGMINLRGQIVLAIDLAFCLGLEPRNSGELSMLVVLRSEDGPASLLVDGIRDIVSVEPEAFEPPPETLQGRSRDFIKGAYKLPRQLLLVLDPDCILEFVGLNGCATSSMLDDSA